MIFRKSRIWIQIIGKLTCLNYGYLQIYLSTSTVEIADIWLNCNDTEGELILDFYY